MKTMQEHISVCICTYKRPRLLAILMKELKNQVSKGLFTYSIVVVDNDDAGSAKPVVAHFARNTAIPVCYDIEPNRSFSLVRNRAVANAGGSHVAFIDDDECPGPDWLFSLFRTMKEYKADGVLGPVVPEYETEPPEWVIRGKLYERENFETGTVIRNHVYTRTGNTLLDRSLFQKAPVPFDPKFGCMGGEDTDFFRRMMNDGRTFVWCQEAPVREWVPRERISISYLLKRALMRGFLESKDPVARGAGVLKSFMAILLYTLALPFALLVGKHAFMTYLIKDCDHLGKVLGFCGVPLFSERTF